MSQESPGGWAQASVPGIPGDGDGPGSRESLRVGTVSPGSPRVGGTASVPGVPGGVGTGQCPGSPRGWGQASVLGIPGRGDGPVSQESPGVETGQCLVL